jgi:hypothetical protein
VGSLCGLQSLDCVFLCCLQIALRRSYQSICRVPLKYFDWEYEARFVLSQDSQSLLEVRFGIWECCDDAKVQRGTGSRVGLRRLELSILRSEKKGGSQKKSASDG